MPAWVGLSCVLLAAKRRYVPLSNKSKATCIELPLAEGVEPGWPSKLQVALRQILVLR